MQMKKLWVVPSRYGWALHKIDRPEGAFEIAFTDMSVRRGPIASRCVPATVSGGSFTGDQSTRPAPCPAAKYREAAVKCGVTWPGDPHDPVWERQFTDALHGLLVDAAAQEPLQVKSLCDEIAATIPALRRPPRQLLDAVVQIVLGERPDSTALQQYGRAWATRLAQALGPFFGQADVPTTAAAYLRSLRYGKAVERRPMYQCTDVIDAAGVDTFFRHHLCCCDRRYKKSSARDRHAAYCLFPRPEMRAALLRTRSMTDFGVHVAKLSLAAARGARRRRRGGRSSS